MDEHIKFGLGIMCWEDTTWLYPIVKELREICDIIVVGWQEYSYGGEKLSEETYNNVHSELESLYNKELIDTVLTINNVVNNPDKYNTDHTLSNEVNKRNVLHNFISDQNVDYVLIIDSDEFHFKEDICNALSYMKSNNLMISYSFIKSFFFNTYIEYKNTETDAVNYLVSSSLKYPFSFEPIDNLNLDITRTLNTNFDGIVFSDIFVYHLSWIRPSFNNKIINYSQPALTKECDIDTLNKLDEEIILKDEIFKHGGLEFKCFRCNYPELNKKLIKHLLDK